MLLIDRGFGPVPKVYGIPLNRVERKILKRRVRHTIASFIIALIERRHGTGIDYELSDIAKDLLRVPVHRLSDRQLVSLELAYHILWSDLYDAPDLKKEVKSVLFKNLEETKK